MRNSIFEGKSKMFKFDENGLGQCLNLVSEGVESISIVYMPDFKEIMERESELKINNNRIKDRLELFEI